MRLRFDPLNSNPARHQRQDAIILRGISGRNERADLAHQIAQGESAANMRKGISLRDFYASAAGFFSLFR